MYVCVHVCTHFRDSLHINEYSLARLWLQSPDTHSINCIWRLQTHPDSRHWGTVWRQIFSRSWRTGDTLWASSIFHMKIWWAKSSSNLLDLLSGIITANGKHLYSLLVSNCDASAEGNSWSNESFPSTHFIAFPFSLPKKFFPSHRRIASDYASDASNAGNSPEIQHQVGRRFLPLVRPQEDAD